MRYLGIDFGTKRIGLALSDSEEVMAFPHSVTEAGKDLVEKIVALCKKEGASEVIVGESKDFDGSDNPVMKKILYFKKELETQGFIVHLEPEFMTSAEAQKMQPALSGSGEGRELRPSRKKAKNATLDASAATLILQSFLDKKKNI